MMEIAYLAGLFDGEGCIHIPVMTPKWCKSPNYGLRVIYSLVHEEVIRRIALQTGTRYCRLRKNNPLWRDAFQVQLCGERAAGLLRVMMPYLIVKREEAELAIKLQDHITQYRNKWKRMTQPEKDAVLLYREGLRLQIKALKRSGATDGMMVNSENTLCPASDGAEGQPRAKQTALKAVGRV